MERTHVTDNLIGADQEITDKGIRFTFLGEVETLIR